MSRRKEKHHSETNDTSKKGTEKATAHLVKAQKKNKKRTRTRGNKAGRENNQTAYSHPQRRMMPFLLMITTKREEEVKTQA